MLYIFGGLPATGKTTIAKLLAKQLKATYLRIDTLEQTLIDLGIATSQNMEGNGYILAHSIAKENLLNGVDVIADCVNPLELTRNDWRRLAVGTGATCLEIEVVCSDTDLHKARAENRKADIFGMRLPTWSDIENRNYEPWSAEHLTIDTTQLLAEEAVQSIMEVANAMGYRRRISDSGTYISITGIVEKFGFTPKDDTCPRDRAILQLGCEDRYMDGKYAMMIATHIPVRAYDRIAQKMLDSVKVGTKLTIEGMMDNCNSMTAGGEDIRIVQCYARSFHIIDPVV